MSHFLPHNHKSKPRENDRLPSALPNPGDTPPQFIKAEANLLRLPLFALTTKGLKTLDGIECRGSTTHKGQLHQFVFRATRNTATLYPGLLARSAHSAFLSLVTDQGLPVSNPIAWSWRDLCRRIGIVCSGKTVLELKAAIAATRGLIIESQHAIYSKPDSKPLSTTQRHLSLYRDLAFVNSRLPDGSVADSNYVWFADWYLANLNTLFTAPLDYDLWRYLDQRSPIASRLYEFLLLNFYSGTPLLRINYPNLAQYLPIRPEKYFSDAKRQLDPACKLLRLTDITEAVDWAKTKTGVPQVLFHRGPRLAASRGRKQPALGFLMEEQFSGNIQLKELRHLKPPEWGIVSDFYRLWAGQENPRPTTKELGQARTLIERYGATKAKALVPWVVERLRQKFPDAKTFGATGRYLDDAATDYDHNQQNQAQKKRLRQQQRQQHKTDAEKQARDRTFNAIWRPVWQSLSEAEQHTIRSAVLAKHAVLRGREDSGFFESQCLKELARGRGPANTNTTPSHPNS